MPGDGQQIDPVVVGEWLGSLGFAQGVAYGPHGMLFSRQGDELLLPTTVTVRDYDRRMRQFWDDLAAVEARSVDGLKASFLAHSAVKEVLPVVKMPVVQSARYQDGIDADRHINRWLEDLASRWQGLPPTMETFGLRLMDPSALPNGRVTVVWDGCHQVGIATVVRDDFNRSVLTIVEHGERADQR